MPTVEELQKKLADEKAAREKAEADVKIHKAAADKATSDFSESQKAAGKKAIADFIESGIKDGKILPAWKAQGIETFMAHLDGVTDKQVSEYAFSEGKGKQTPAAWFREFITSFSEHPLFKDMVKPESDGKKPGDEIDFSEPLTDKV